MIEEKRKSPSSMNKSVEGKSSGCLPGARISSVRAVRKTCGWGWKRKAALKLKQKWRQNPPTNSLPLPPFPLRPCQAGRAPFGAGAARGGQRRQTPACLENCCPKKTDRTRASEGMKRSMPTALPSSSPTTRCGWWGGGEAEGPVT